ncbi:MAG: putative Xre antitoxin-family protein [uncultured marine phage]|uniref:Putative Xre antitoxin-family protein n=1 Tax=uncultured marine phage TaxID=707152 RepID=A0A8D9FRS2_9VIRU|nr:MAG: putative Xre antitoxin-family protein [uncultured marine phage]
MKLIYNLNRKYLNLIYSIGDKLKNPLWIILSIWIPLSTIILLSYYEVVSNDTLVKGLIFLSIPIVYATILLTRDIRIKKKKYTELKQLGVKVFGDETKYREWMYSDIISLNNKKPIDVDADEAREVLIKIDNGIYS